MERETSAIQQSVEIGGTGQRRGGGAFALGGLQAGEPEFQTAADLLSGCEQYSWKHFSR